MTCESNNSRIIALEREITELEVRLADLKARLPAHSVPPAMIAVMDEIDGRLEEARIQLNQELAS